MARAQGMYKFSGAYQQKQEALRQARIQERKSVSSGEALQQISSQLKSQPGVEGVEGSDVGYWYGVDYTGERELKPSGFGYTSSGYKRRDVDPLYKVNVKESLNRFYAGDVSFFNIEKATEEDRFNIPEFHGTGTGDLERASAYQQRMEVEAAEQAQAKQKSVAVSEIESVFKQSLEGTTNKYTKEGLAYQQQKVREAGYSQESIDAYNKEMERWAKNEESKSIQREYNYRIALQDAQKGLVQPSSIQGESTTAKTAREYVTQLNKEVTASGFSEQAVNKYNTEIEKLNRNISAKSTQAEWNVLQPYIGSTDKYYRQQGTTLKPVSLGEVQESLDKPFYAFKPKQAEAIERGQYKVDAAGGVTIYDPVTAQSKMPKYDPTKKGWQQDFVVLTKPGSPDAPVATYRMEGNKSFEDFSKHKSLVPDASKPQRTKADDWYTAHAARFGDFISDWGRVLVVPREKQIESAYKMNIFGGAALEFYSGGVETIIETPRIVGYGMLGTEQILRNTVDYNEEFQKKTGFNLYTPPAVVGVGSYALESYLDIGRSFVKNPVRTSGGIAGGMVVGKAVGVGGEIGTKAWGLVKTVGKKYIPIEKIGYEPKYGYPISKDITAKSIVKSFEKGTLEPTPQYMRSPTGKIEVPYVPKDTHLPLETPGEMYMYTAWERPISADRMFGKLATIGEGSSELKGIYGSPDITTYFTKYGGASSESTIGVDLSLFKRPGIVRTHLKGIETPPEKLSASTRGRVGRMPARKAYEQMQKFADTREPGVSTSPLTKMEYETVLPVGNIVEIQPIRYYTKLGGIGKGRWFGTRIPITEVTAIGEKVGTVSSPKQIRTLDIEGYKSRPKYNVPDYATSFGGTSSTLKQYSGKSISSASKSYTNVSETISKSYKSSDIYSKNYLDTYKSSTYIPKSSITTSDVNKYVGSPAISKTSKTSNISSYKSPVYKYSSTAISTSKITPVYSGKYSYYPYGSYDYTYTPNPPRYPYYKPPKKHTPIIPPSSKSYKKGQAKRKSKIGGFTWKITNPVPTFESLGFTPLKKTGKKSKKKIGGISL